MPNIANLRRWRNGEIFSARDYVYERDTIINQVNRLSVLVGDATGTPVDLTVAALTASSITVGGQTIDQLVRGQSVYTTNSEPTDESTGDLWFDPTI